MADLATWAQIGEAVGGLAVLSGVAYAIYELRRARQARVTEAAFQISTLFQDQAYLDAVALVLTLPRGADAATVRADPHVHRAAAYVVTRQFTLGVNAYLGAYPPTTVWQQDPWHSWNMWARLADWVKANRQRVGPSAFWAFEWLIGQGQQQGVFPAEPRADPRPFTPGDRKETT